MSELADYVNGLVTTLLLGTDRTPAPDPPSGPLAQFDADIGVDGTHQTPLQRIAAVTAARRAGWQPHPPVAPTISPTTLAASRPVATQAIAATWRQIVSDWPLLEDEWLATMVETGWLAGPELTLPLVLRHRVNVRRMTMVAVVCGPIIDVLFSEFPDLAPRRKPAAADPPELITVQALRTLLAGPPSPFIDELVDGLHRLRYNPTHRAVLEHAVATVNPATLLPLAAALDDTDRTLPSIGLAFALAELARLRHQALTELHAIPEHP